MIFVDIQSLEHSAKCLKYRSLCLLHYNIKNFVLLHIQFLAETHQNKKKTAT